MNYFVCTLTPGSYLYKTSPCFYPKLEKDFEINVAVYSQYAAQIKITTPEEVNRFQKSSWNPPQLQEQYKADQQAKKKSKDTGLTSEEADKLAALDTFEQLKEKNQSDQQYFVPPKNNQDHGNKNGYGNNFGGQINQNEEEQESNVPFFSGFGWSDKYRISL